MLKYVEIPMDPYGSLTILIVQQPPQMSQMPSRPRRCDAFLSVAGVGDATRKGEGLSAGFGRLPDGREKKGKGGRQRPKMIFLMFFLGIVFGIVLYTSLLNMANLVFSVNSCDILYASEFPWGSSATVGHHFK